MNPSAFRCEWTPKEDIWKVAEQIRMEYWLEGTLPINVERIVEIKLKLDIIPTPGIYSVLDTDAWLQRNLQGIVVDQDSYLNPKFANRLRFSLAHELGHYFLHSSIYSGLQFNGLEEWKDFVENLPDAEYRGFEWQANEFAGRFLVPRDALVLGLEKAIQEIRKNAFCGIPIPKRLIPKEYVQKYGAKNLWKYDLPDGWRLIYTITTPNKIEILSIILEWFDHPNYERRFGY